jgi:hypothetical protein
MRGMSIPEKVWLVGFVLIYAAAKVHTFMTVGSEHYLERHWPFWAAMVAWGTLGVAACGLAGYVTERWQSRHSRPDASS